MPGPGEDPGLSFLVLGPTLCYLYPGVQVGGSEARIDDGGPGSR